jgi:tetratricopeptide (TPR) repeat protein
MTATKVIAAQDQGGAKNDVGERSDAATSSGPCGNPGMFAWCEVEMIQDAVCGNGLNVTESRDDETQNETSPASPEVGGERILEDKLKAFSEELDLTERLSFKGSSSGNQETAVCKSNVTKGSMLSRISSSSTSISGVDKTRYDHLMCLVDKASKTYGAQSIDVAVLYVNLGTECGRPCTDVRSKELAVQLYEEAFNIYQAKLGDSHNLTIQCRVHLGNVCLSLERYDEALDSFCMAVYMREALLGELHQSASEIWVLISSVHQATSKLELALKASAKALTGYRHVYGDKHQTVIGVLKTIVQIHIGMGNADKANDIYKYVRLHSSKDEIIQ